MRIQFVVASLVAMINVAPSPDETSLTANAPVDFDLSWFTIDGGGVQGTSANGAFELSGTIGQADAVVLSGERFELTGGFWFETPPGDCNGDGILGLSDHDRFVDCLAGPAGKIAAECACFDVDGSRTVDLADFSESQRGLVGRTPHILRVWEAR